MGTTAFFFTPASTLFGKVDFSTSWLQVLGDGTLWFLGAARLVKVATGWGCSERTDVLCSLLFSMLEVMSQITVTKMFM